MVVTSGGTAADGMAFVSYYYPGFHAPISTTLVCFVVSHYAMSVWVLQVLQASSPTWAPDTSTGSGGSLGLKVSSNFLSNSLVMVMVRGTIWHSLH